MILKQLKRSPNSSNSSSVLKRFSNSPQSTRKFINVRTLLSRLSGSQRSSISWEVLEILKGFRSSIGPQEVIKSTWKVLQCSESIRYSGLQKGLKRSTKSSKSQENVQMLPKVLSGLSFSTDPQNILKFLKRSSQPSKSSEAHQRYSRGPQSPQNVIKVLKIPCRQKFLKIHQMVLTKSSKVPKKVLKRSTRSHQKILRSSPMFWDPHVLRSSKSPQKLNKVLKKSRKCTKCTQGPQASGFQVIHKMSSNSSKGPHSLRSPQRSTKGI